MSSLKTSMSINDLLLWPNNPRLDKDLFNQGLNEGELLRYLLMDNDVKSKLEPLAEDIYDKKEVLESFIVYKDVSDEKIKFFAYDGNRRLMCFKLHLYPEIINDFRLNADLFKDIYE